jgi:hypothetical protein
MTRQEVTYLKTVISERFTGKHPVWRWNSLEAKQAASVSSQELPRHEGVNFPLSIVCGPGGQTTNSQGAQDYDVRVQDCCEVCVPY